MASMRDVQGFCEEVARKFRPRKIVLFGSHAYGEPHEDSDVDVLVVVASKRKLGPHPAVTIRMAVRTVFPVGLIVRGEREIYRRWKLGDWFLRELTEKGKVLYEAQPTHARVGLQS